MRIVVQIDPTVFDDPRVVAMIARGFLKGVVLQNRLLIRKGMVPSLYEGSGVKFRPEPWAGKFEEFADALTVYKRGWGDCDDLCAWRCAELQEQGGMAWPKIYWRKQPDGTRLYHGEVRIFEKRHGRWIPTNKVEDPSRFLGMADKPRY